jgi:hypothetical protein
MGMRRSDRRKGLAAAQRRRPAFGLAALLAVLLQVFVVQAHVHAPGAGVDAGYELSAVAEHGAAAVHGEATHDDRQIICVLCQTLAAAGSAVLSGGTAVVADHRAAEQTAPTAIRIVPTAHTHSWRSRAPPASL